MGGSGREATECLDLGEEGCVFKPCYSLALYVGEGSSLWVCTPSGPGSFSEPTETKTGQFTSLFTSISQDLLLPRLPLYSKSSSCFSLLTAGIAGVYYLSGYHPFPFPPFFFFVVRGRGVNPRTFLAFFGVGVYLGGKWR